MIKQHDYLFKIVIVGNQGVGKSSLFLRFCDNNFAESYLPTIGVDFRFKMVKVDEKDCKLQIWDTAGQQRFRTITSAYYRSAQAVIIVYDVTDKTTFKEIENFWLQEVKNNTEGNATLIIVGNKSDRKNQIDDQEIQSFVSNAGVSSYFVSAKTGEGVEKMFEQLCQQLIERQKLKPVKIIDAKKKKRIDLDQEQQIQKKKCCK